MEKDYIIRGMDDKNNFRFLIASTTNMVEQLREVHNTSPVATAALGRLATAASIMGDMLKNKKEKLTIQIKSDGAINNIIATVNYKNEVKACISDNLKDVPLTESGKLDVGGAIGAGNLVVTRDIGLREPSVGYSPLVSGEIAEDLTYYFASSEQQPSAVALGVLVDKDLSVKAAGGYIIQVMPGTGEEEIAKLEKNLAESESVSAMIDRGMVPEDILKNIFKGFDTKILGKNNVSYKCDCSRERIEQVLISLGVDELREMKEDEKTEVQCHFCNTKYVFSNEGIDGMIEKLENN